MTLLLSPSLQEHCEGHEGTPGGSADCGDQSNAELQSGNVAAGSGCFFQGSVSVGDNGSASRQPLSQGWQCVTCGCLSAPVHGRHY